MYCATNILMEMIEYQNMVDVFYSVKTLRNAKPNMVETLVGAVVIKSVFLFFYFQIYFLMSFHIESEICVRK